MTTTSRVREHRARLRERGDRPVQFWVPDARTDAFRNEARRESRLVAAGEERSDDQDFVEAISATWDD